jgi:hypothetical protein
LGPECAKLLTQALKALPIRLVVLDLCGNRIGDAGALCLSDLLQHVSSERLALVDVAHNEISDPGARMLANALCQRRFGQQLGSLRLVRNRISPAGNRLLTTQYPLVESVLVL